MAKEEEKDQEKEEGGKQSGPSTVKIIIIVVVLVLVLGGGMAAATFYFISNTNSDDVSSTKDSTDESSEEEAAESEPVAPPQYYSMDPKFVASFANQQNARFMQFSLEIMARDSEVIKLVETHMSVIRSSLLMLFGSQTYADMVTREGKEKLLTDVAADINATLQKITGKTEATVESAYFNSFVIQ